MTATAVQNELFTHESFPHELFPVSRLPVVNVASVPQRSPLRYPGGKTWLIPHIREWLTKTDSNILVEPFAGGCVISLTAVMEKLVDRSIMIEIDRDVAAFWHSALSGGTTLADMVAMFDPTYELISELEGKAPGNVFEHGFRTLVLNRTKRGGILAPGASFSRHGENGKGILSRWYPDTLIARLQAIQAWANKLAFFEGDGMKLMEPLLHGWGQKAAVFIDPPYTAKGGKRAGSRLYAHNEIDHAALFALLARYRPNFLMTYDAASEIVDLVHQHNFTAVCVQMKNCHHNHLPELIITPEPLFS